MLDVLTSSTVTSLGSTNYSNKANLVQYANCVTNALEISAPHRNVR